MSAPGDIRSTDGASTQLVDFTTTPGAIGFTNLGAPPPVSTKAQLYAQGGQVIHLDTLGNATTILNGDPVAAQQNMIAWNGDPAGASQEFQLTTGGTVHLAKVWVPAPTKITNVVVTVSTAGATLTAGQNLMGLFSTNLITATLLSATGDQTAAFGAAGHVIAPLTTPQSVAAGFVYVGVFYNGTTAPKLATFSGLTPGNVGMSNVGLALATARHQKSGSTGNTTTMPASITLSGGSLQEPAFFAAVS